MDRPDKSKYMYEEFDDIGTYMKDLETYCDQLEKDLAREKERRNKYFQWICSNAKANRYYRNLFYQACDELVYYQKELYTIEKMLTNLGNVYHIENDIEPRDKLEWQEYFYNKNAEEWD